MQQQRFHDLLADRGVRIVKRGQAVHELHLRVAGRLQQLPVDLEVLEQVNTFRPHRVGLAHRHPDVGVDEIHALDACRRVFREGQAAHADGFQFTGVGDVPLVRPEFAWRRDADVHAHQAAGDHQRVAHVVAGVAQVAVGNLVPGAGLVLAHGHQVGRHLGGVPLVRETVVHGHAGVDGEFLDDGLRVPAVLDGVVHAAEHARGIPDRFLLADV